MESRPKPYITVGFNTFMHSAHHLGTPLVQLATDEVLLGVEYAAPSIVGPGKATTCY